MKAARLVNKVPQVTSPTLDKTPAYGTQTDPGPSTVTPRKPDINGEFEHTIAVFVVSMTYEFLLFESLTYIV